MDYVCLDHVFFFFFVTLPTTFVSFALEFLGFRGNAFGCWFTMIALGWGGYK